MEQVIKGTRLQVASRQPKATEKNVLPWDLRHVTCDWAMNIPAASYGVSEE